MWVVANEPASHEEGAHEYFEPLVKLYKDLDPEKRPVTLVNIMMANPKTIKLWILLMLSVSTAIMVGMLNTEIW